VSEGERLGGRRWADIDYMGDGVVGHRLDVVQPVTGQGPFPPIVVIYGSAFRSNDWKQIGFETLSKPLLEAGFAVVAINHRSSTDAIWPAQIHD
jgi:acetyl esterase/lipase